MTKEWTRTDIRWVARAHMPSAILLAAAELAVFEELAVAPMRAPELATAVGADPRATTMLADALVATELLDKNEGTHALAPGTADVLTAKGSDTILPYVLHTANTMRIWARLAEVVLEGGPVEVGHSIRGAESDREAYIETMTVNAHQAAEVIAALGPLEFEHMLDVGCGPATWAIAVLQAVPGARATLYDLPDVVAAARTHVEAAGLADRVTFVSGDFMIDEALPAGADLAWVGAIPHQYSRQQNRGLFAKVHAAMQPGGQIVIRDIVMNEDHTKPFFGAMFAILMLVRMKTGGTFSFEEFKEDLALTGFEGAELFRHERPMDSIIRARRIDVVPD